MSCNFTALATDHDINRTVINDKQCLQPQRKMPPAERNVDDSSEFANLYQPSSISILSTPRH